MPQQEQQYALYEYHHKETQKAYVGIYKYTPDRNYVSSSRNDEFWADYKAGKLTRKITWISDEATVRCMEDDILSTIRLEGNMEAFYNLQFGGGVRGVHFTEEVRDRLSDNLKGKWKDPEYRAKQKAGMNTLEAKANYSNSNKNNWDNPERKVQQSERAKSQWQDPEHRAKMRVKSKELWQDPEHIAKMSEIQRAIRSDPEYKVKASETAKVMWKDPEYRAKISAIRIETGKDPEYKAKVSSNSKKMWQDPEYRAKQINSMSGKNNYKARSANIYDYYTDELVAENIVISEWCREHGYNRPHLSATALADRSKASSRTNRRHTRGIYAIYQD